MLEVVFDDKFLLLNENGSKLKEQIGLIVHNPHRVPLTYLDWRAVPLDIKDVIWREIQDNVTDCPEGFYPVTMRACNKLWKDHKGESKNEFLKLRASWPCS